MKKSIRNLVIGAVMTAGIIAASASALAATQFVQENMNFRNGSSITATIIGSVPEGAEVEVLGQQNGWDLIKYNGVIGFIHGGNLADTYDAKQNTGKGAAPAASHNTHNTGNGAAPTGGQNTGKDAAPATGQNTTPAAQNQTDNYPGVSNDTKNYLDTNWSQTAQNMDITENGTWKIVNVEVGYLALRTGPAYGNNEIGQLYTGDTVMLIGGAEGSYVRAYSPKYGTHGWVNAGFLK